VLFAIDFKIDDEVSFVSVREDVNIDLNNAAAVVTGSLLKPMLYGSALRSIENFYPAIYELGIAIVVVIDLLNVVVTAF